VIISTLFSTGSFSTEGSKKGPCFQKKDKEKEKRKLEKKWKNTACGTLK
jgi:hypothetical protein